MATRTITKLEKTGYRNTDAVYKADSCGLPPVHPGLLLRRQVLAPLNLTVQELANRLQLSRKHVSDLLNARTSLTPNVALRLQQLTGARAQMWLGLQADYDFDLASKAYAKQRLNIEPLALTPS